MTRSERRWRHSAGRRKALASLAGFLIAAESVHSQQDTFRDHSRVAGLDEMRDVFDFEAAAYERLDRATYNYTARGGGSEFTVRRNREAFEWATLVPQTVGRSVPPQTSTEILGRGCNSRSCSRPPQLTLCCIRTKKREPTRAAPKRPRHR